MNYYLCIGWKPAAFEKMCVANFNHEPKMSFCDGRTLIWEKEGKGRVITIWTKNKDFSTLAHECVHAANFTLESIKHIHSYDNDEVQAYLVAWLVKVASKVIRGSQRN